MKRELLGGLAAAALIGSGLAMSSASTVTVGKSPDFKCKTGVSAPSNARVVKGYEKKLDPNTLTVQQAAAMEARIAAFLDANNIQTSARPVGSVKIPVRVHVITRDDGTGNVKNWRIKRQITVLNNAFAGRTAPAAANTPFRFRLKSIDRTRNTDWFNMNWEDSKEARRALRQGDARHLNIYTTNFAGNLQGLLGFATFPESYKKYPKLDGTVLFHESLPGGDAIYQDDDGHTFNYAKGDTGTHEVGHWMNLYHTFQGGCSANNDFVVDTPWQRAGSNIFYCKPNQNTCGGKDSRGDPTKNFMNYVDDPCMNRFTRGQRDRMDIAWYIRQAIG